MSVRLHARFINYVPVQYCMAYTEIKQRNGKNYFYRVRSVRDGKRISKDRIYLGVDLLEKELSLRKSMADKKFGVIIKKNEIDLIKQKIIKILKKNKVKRAGIFGSYARGEAKKNSDVDILLEPPKNISLLDLSGLKIELEDKLNKKVDIISYNYIHPKLKEKILKSEVRII